MVLPCGHTYICEQCVNRLDKCVECRLPLTKEYRNVTRPTSSTNNGGAPVNNGEIRSWRDRNRPRVNTLRSSGSSTASQASASSGGGAPRLPSLNAGGGGGQVRLPTPKNHVLMCLIEATQKSQAQANDDGDGYDSGEDEDLVLQGLQVMGSSSGTYMVRAPDGLIVHPLKRKKNSNNTKESVPDEGYRLEYGQTVQIFLFENGIATVARGAGCILVDNNSHLVKGKNIWSSVSLVFVG